MSVDFVENTEATFNVILNKQADFITNADTIVEKLQGALQGKKLDAILSVAGGWTGGNLASQGFLKGVELMHEQSVQSSVIAAQLGSLYLKQYWL